MNSFFASLTPAARIGLGLGLLLILAFAVTASLLLRSPGFEPLFVDLREDDAAQISQQLEQWKIEYRIGEDGRSLSVPAGHAQAVRLRLVSSGVPSGGRVGFELFKDSNFGVTEFAQRINFQRALQGELERTIGSFAGVERARVHLNLPEGQGLLGREQTKKASVALSLRPQSRLDAGQVRGIQDLVAAAVEGLSADSVVVLDERGQPLQARSGDSASDATRRDGPAELESVLAQRIAYLLEALYPADAFRIAVDVTFTVASDEAPALPQATARPTPVVNGKGAANGNGNGAPRALPPPATARPVGAAGSIERVSIAVLLPEDSPVADLDRLRALIGAAAGLRSERGDQLELVPLIATRPVERDSEAPAAARHVAATPAPAAADRGTALRPSLLAGILIAVLALLLGIALGRRRQRLDPRQREAALARMQAWLRAGVDPA